MFLKKLYSHIHRWPKQKKLNLAYFLVLVIFTCYIWQDGFLTFQKKLKRAWLGWESTDLKSQGCPAFDRWRFSIHQKQLKHDAAPTRQFFDDLVEQYSIHKIVHFLSTEDRTIVTFKRYISILSAIKYLEPSLVIVHSANEPEFDKSRYHQWWDELVESVPFLKVEIVPKTTTVDDVLRKYGGFYIPWDDVLIIEPTKSDLVNYNYGKNDKAIYFFGNGNNLKIDCEPLSDLKQLSHTSPATAICINFVGNSTRALYPKDILVNNDWFSKHVRGLVYATKNPLVAQPKETLIPLICHYIWLNGDAVTLETFLSILSCLFVLRADVYVHGSDPPSGRRWQKIVKLANGRIRFIRLEFPDVIYGNPLPYSVDDHSKKAHTTDVVRLHVLLKYGGIYIDWDAYWVHELPDELRHYEAVVSYDIWSEPDFPELIQNGVMLAQPNSVFVNHYQRNYRYFLDAHYFYNSMYLMYKTYECYPDSLRIDPRVNVICANRHCYPAWQENYEFLFKNEIDYELDIDSGEVFVIHYTQVNIREFENERILAQALHKAETEARPSLFVKMARKILAKANITANSLID